MAMGNTVTYRWSTTGGPGLPDTIVCPEEVTGTTSFDGGGYKSGTKSFLSDGYYVFSGWKYSINYKGVTTEYGIIDKEPVYEDLDIYGTWTWYTQTVDEIGDEALAASIIDRSITYIYDVVTTSIGTHAFYQCSNLTTVNFQNVTTINNSAFSACHALQEFVCKCDIYISDGSFQNAGVKLVDLWGYAVLNVDNSYVRNAYMFRGTPLAAIILRSASLCKIGTNTYGLFYGCPIDSGTGYIYVPRDLVDSYKADSKWSTYADQIRALEDYTDDGTVTGTFIPPSS